MCERKGMGKRIKVAALGIQVKCFEVGGRMYLLEYEGSWTLFQRMSPAVEQGVRSMWFI